MQTLKLAEAFSPYESHDSVKFLGQILRGDTTLPKDPVKLDRMMKECTKELLEGILFEITYNVILYEHLGIIYSLDRRISREELRNKFCRYLDECAETSAALLIGGDTRFYLVSYLYDSLLKDNIFLRKATTLELLDYLNSHHSQDQDGL